MECSCKFTKIDLNQRIFSAYFDWIFILTHSQRGTIRQKNTRRR